MSTSLYRITGAGCVLALFIAVLPIPSSNRSNEESAETCLRLADTPPAAGPEALRELERCREVVPQDVELLADLGGAYESAGRLGEAEKVFRDVLVLDPGYADVHVRLATLLLRRDAAAEARSHAERALSLQPNRASVQRLLDDIARSLTP